MNCLDCKKITSTKKTKRCWDCFVIYNRGEKTWQYKGGKPKCLDCGGETKQYNTKRCRSCYLKTMKGATAPRYKGIIYSLICLECGNFFSSKRARTKCCSWSCYVALKRRPLGDRAYNWIDERTKKLENYRIRGSQEWKNWRMKVFERDKYTCRECGACGVYIEPHHIVPMRSDKSRLFKIENGITLCRPCHLKTFGKESNFADKYSALVVAQTQ